MSFCTSSIEAWSWYIKRASDNNSIITSNSSVDERYSQTPITAWTTPGLYNFTTLLLNFPVTFAYLIGEMRLFRRIVTYFIIVPYKYSYLFTGEFLVDKYLLHVQTKTFITRPRMLYALSNESLRITKLPAKLKKPSDSAQSA